jgi:ubiquinone biosynthesis protein
LVLAPGNTVGYADFGLCEKLDQHVSRELARYLAGIHRPDLQQMLGLILALAVPAEGADGEKLKDEFMAEGHRWLGNISPVSAGRRPTDNRPPAARWIVGVMAALRRNRFQLPNEILALFRALASAETLAYRLAPSVHLRAPVAREYFAALELEETFRLLDPGVQQNLAVKLLTGLRDAPEQLNHILQELAEGRLAINLNVTEPSGTGRARDRRSRLIVAATMSVAVAWMIAEGGLPAIGSIPASRILGLVLGLLYLYIFIQVRLM